MSKEQHDESAKVEREAARSKARSVFAMEGHTGVVPLSAEESLAFNAGFDAGYDAGRASRPTVDVEAELSADVVQAATDFVETRLVNERCLRLEAELTRLRTREEQLEAVVVKYADAVWMCRYDGLAGHRCNSDCKKTTLYGGHGYEIARAALSSGEKE